MSIWTLAIADNHAGSPYGLSKPCYLHRPFKKEGVYKDWTATKLYLHNRLRQQGMDFANAIKKAIKDLPKIDYCYIVSDTVEGSKDKEGGAELLTTDMSKQEDMAVDVLDDILTEVGRPKVWGVRGTRFHVTAKGGRESDDGVYDRLPNMQGYDDVMFVENAGLIWKLQHFVGRSSTFQGKQTHVVKQLIQNTLGVAMEKEHDADVLLFGHVHYCVGASFPMSHKRGYTLPCLKLRGESYGRQYNDFYDVGLLFWKQDKEGAPLQEYSVKVKIAYTKPRLWKG